MGNYDDSELVQVSALEHWVYCPRQCALIHLEQTFAWPITGNLVARLVGASFQAIWTRE